MRLCAVCGSGVPVGDRFCSNCGAEIPRECPACGSLVTPEAQFCGQCGAALDSRPDAEELSAVVPPPATERRLVTVLFADLVGFTSRSEHQDPEEVASFLREYFERAREVVRCFGGLVEKFAGDADGGVGRASCD